LAFCLNCSQSEEAGATSAKSSAPANASKPALIRPPPCFHRRKGLNSPPFPNLSAYLFREAFQMAGPERRGRTSAASLSTPASFVATCSGPLRSQSTFPAGKSERPEHGRYGRPSGPAPTQSVSRVLTADTFRLRPFARPRALRASVDRVLEFLGQDRRAVTAPLERLKHQPQQH
jgi:hypothetical protein